MSDGKHPAPRRSWKLWLFVAAIPLMGSLMYTLFASMLSATLDTGRLPKPQMLPEPREATSEEVHRLCGACHAYPPPDTFPRFAWRAEVNQGYGFFHDAPSYRFDYPPLEAVVRYYESRAPEALALLPQKASPQAPRARFERRVHGAPEGESSVGISHINLVHLFSKTKLEILVCDVLANQVLLLDPSAAAPLAKVIARVPRPAHTEVVDLDGDGINDIVVACLGKFQAISERVGSVVWLKGAADGTFTPVTLLDGVGRVADVRVADFTGDGKLDLVVAEFGWRDVGAMLLLENQTTDWARPVFTPRLLDDRHGTTHVPVADLNGDGKPDFVAVISQEHETVVAFLNEGGGRFRREIIYEAPHPSFGCNGVQIIDLDLDGDLDVVLTNGDALDKPFLLRPYHGVTWLENRGRYPFTPHRLTDCYGAGSPAVADFDGNGLLDIAVVTFLPVQDYPERVRLKLDAVVLLEQMTPGKFVRHALEVETCDHLACAAGDLDGDGRPDLVVGNCVLGSGSDEHLAIWRNARSKRVDGVRSKP